MADQTRPADGDRLIDEMQAGIEAVRREIGKVIIGQTAVVDEMLVALLAGGHVLLEGVPGLAKTRLIATLARAMDLSFSRIQFTPDLMPGDITGSEILDDDAAGGGREFRFVKGPVFANIVLADEINRTPPKTQAALLQAMQEHEVTVAGATYRLDPPFFVLATQNPIEQEGTYPLPEAQLDRFMLNILIDYPSYEEELAIASLPTDTADLELTRVLDADFLLRCRDVAANVTIARETVEFAVKLVRATREPLGGAEGAAESYLSWGAGPRASQYLLQAIRYRCLVRGRYTADREDVAAMALPVLRHRIVPSFRAELADLTRDDLVAMIVDKVAAE